MIKGKRLHVVTFISEHLSELNKKLLEVGDNVYSLTPIYNTRHNYMEYVLVYYI